ncbi:MAG: DegT/DnrJ/EryC1/StrS family aminotransferase [Chloroflexota bacterium]|nr:MAG: DegT/DnrJ/EryC1/StrS family aminotransferase [Chloroflexota bacterium]
MGYGPGDFPLTERYAGEILSLPMFPAMSDAQQDRVIEAIRHFDFGPEAYKSAGDQIVGAAAD